MDNNENYNKKGFYTVLYTLAAIFIILAFGISILNSGNSGSNDNEVDFEEDISPVDKSNVKPLTTTETTTKEVKAEAVTEAITQSTADNTVSDNGELSLFDDSQEMEWPVSGQIVMDYSNDTGIYDRTLEQYRTNDSICISADIGTEVCAASDGIITSITKDKISGVTVSVDHGNGWSSTYSQLDENLAVSEGEAIHKGDKIGAVTNPTNYSVALGPHLEFAVFNNETATDPKLVLAQAE
ncbi:MAG: M23 family metallopeptidase [Clostridia bacterium]|nr:M23 family metallopeptidase [Clostridia bacterium]